MDLGFVFYARHVVWGETGRARAGCVHAPLLVSNCENETLSAIYLSLYLSPFLILCQYSGFGAKLYIYFLPPNTLRA